MDCPISARCVEAPGRLYALSYGIDLMQTHGVVRVAWFLPEALFGFLPLSAFLAVKSVVGIPSGQLALVLQVLMTAVSVLIVRHFVPPSYLVPVWCMGYFAVGVLRTLARLCATMF